MPDIESVYEREHARQLDKQDQLSSYRKEFYVKEDRFTLIY
jgi:hypothetical protein